MSADATVITFGSVATNLASGQSDTNSANDMFLFERGAIVVPSAPTNVTPLLATPLPPSPGARLCG